MNYKQLTESEATYIEACIIEGHETIDVSVVPLQDYIDLFAKLGFIRDENEDNLNGYSVDFWYDFTNKEFGTYILSGSLWYGEYTISKKED